MSAEKIRTIGGHMLNEAQAIRAAFPDVGAMRVLPVSVLPAAVPGDSAEQKTYRTALGYLRDEMLLVRAGGADDLTVLNDEIACVERLCPR